MRSLHLIAALAATCCALPSAPAWGRTLCVGDGDGCSATIQSALEAAHDGDVIRVGPGRYRGPIVITKSVKLAGAGADATTIKGGGPVISVGEFLGAHQPTVTIVGITITGGVTTSSGESQAFVDADNVIAAGGGLKINPAADFSTGATVTVSDSVITGNRAAPTAALPLGPPCPDGPCPFAMARGGGIDNWGGLTLLDTTVSDNVAAGAASDADGGGINNWRPASLQLRDSAVTGNRALVVAPNGRFAEGGGIFADPGVPVDISGGWIDRNRASLTSELPYFVPGEDPIDMNANGGGIHAGDGGAVTIVGASLSGNEVRASDPNGRPVAFDSALHPDGGPLRLRDVTIDGNRLVAEVGSSAEVGASGSAIDINGPGTVTRARITHNSTVVSSQTGVAIANGAVYAGDAGPNAAVIEQSTIAGNETRASSAGGEARAAGAGLVNDGLLRLDGVTISGNSATATAPSGWARGGGIWNGAMFNSPPIRLTLRDTKVTRNVLTGSGGVALSGGGIWTAFPVTLGDSVISGNSPDDCSGC